MITGWKYILALFIGGSVTALWNTYTENIIMGLIAFWVFVILCKVTEKSK
jgi:hypothetical protein